MGGGVYGKLKCKINTLRNNEYVVHAVIYNYCQ